MEHKAARTLLRVAPLNIKRKLLATNSSTASNNIHVADLNYDQSLDIQSY